ICKKPTIMVTARATSLCRKIWQQKCSRCLCTANWMKIYKNLLWKKSGKVLTSQPKDNRDTKPSFFRKSFTIHVWEKRSRPTASTAVVVPTHECSQKNQTLL